MKAVFLTAGAAGMYCGSCMHDNALARALRDQSVDCLLQPVYTPIRTDELSIADDHVFFGGIHIYMLQQFPWFRRIPRPLRRMLDWSPLIRLATSRSMSTDASKLGALAVSMLQGTHGNQAEEVERLVDWLANDIRPDAVLLTNLLIGGSLPLIRKRLPDTRIAVILQGDDIFLDHLPDDSRSQAIQLCRELVEDVDCFVINSRFYADKMGQLLQIPEEKIRISPLSIDLQPFDAPGGDSPHQPALAKSDDEFRVGYLARIAPEKGLHRLVDSFVQLARDGQHDNMTLHVAGWLGDHNKPYLEEQLDKIKKAGVESRFEYHGSPNLEDKVRFLRQLDLFSVPTDYADPKGLFVLEALAAGVPVVMPDHGAFGELVESTGGGVVVPPDDVDALCEGLTNLKADADLRGQLACQGQRRVRSHHSIDRAATQMKEILFSVPASTCEPQEVASEGS